ncbi:MAG: arginine repressor [bacterium]|nr:arginine repressor [bacterium]
MKYKRQGQIIKIISEKQIKTHEQLIEELTKKGYDVTQATVSRDIKELGLVKAPSQSGGSCYSLPTDKSENADKHLNLFSDTVRGVSSALHTVVVRTYPGMASAVAASLDTVMRADILGSIAGDDTLLIITPSEEAAVETAARLRKIFKTEGR